MEVLSSLCLPYQTTLRGIHRRCLSHAFPRHRFDKNKRTMFISSISKFTYGPNHFSFVSYSLNPRLSGILVLGLDLEFTCLCIMMYYDVYCDQHLTEAR